MFIYYIDPLSCLIIILPLQKIDKKKSYFNLKYYTLLPIVLLHWSEVKISFFKLFILEL